MLLVTSGLALSACATQAPFRAELSELEAQVRALRADNARLEQRLERMERGAVVARPGRAAAAVPARAEANAELPALTVVRLKPKKDPAPRIDTQVAVVEPSPDVLDELKAVQAQVGAVDLSTAGGAEAAADDVIEQGYQRGLDSLRTGNVAGGVDTLLAIAQNNPKHPRADNALYYAALGLMGLNNFEDAERLFQQVVDQYPAGDAVQDAHLKVGECRVKLNRPGDAKATYETIVSTYPGSAVATQARARLTNLSLLQANPVP